MQGRGPRPYNRRVLPSADLSGYVAFYGKTAAAVAAAAAGAFLARGFLDRPVAPTRLRAFFWGIWGGVALLFVALSLLSLSTFHKFFDTAVEAQTIRNIARGAGPVSSVNAEGMGDPDHGASYLPYHAVLGYYPAALAYRAVPHAGTVLLLGTLGVLLGAVAVWRFAHEALGPVWGALVPPVAYLLYPTVHYAALWEFHALSLAVPLVAFAARAAWLGKVRTFWVCGALSLLVREDVAIMTGFLGLYGATRPAMRRHGVGLALVAAAYFLTATQLWMPALATRREWHQARLFSHLGGSLTEAAWGLLTRPEVTWRMATDPSRWGNALLFLLPLAGLPLAAGRWALLYAPYFLLLFLGRDYAFYSIFLYYTVPLLPALVAGTAVAAAGRSASRGAWLGAVLGGSLAASVLWGAAPWSAQFWSREWRLAPFREPYFHVSSYIPGAHEAAARRALARIGPEERVAAAHYFLPHLVERERLYHLFSPERLPPDVTAVVFDTARGNAYAGLPYAELEAGLAERGFAVAAREDGVVLMRR